ncbi:hypothetical protein EDEG_02610, partial [Edhazardia aedis USNM 41457]
MFTILYLIKFAVVSAAQNKYLQNTEEVKEASKDLWDIEAIETAIRNFHEGNNYSDKSWESIRYLINIVSESESALCRIIKDTENLDFNDLKQLDNLFLFLKKSESGNITMRRDLNKPYEEIGKHDFLSAWMDGIEVLIKMKNKEAEELNKILNSDNYWPLLISYFGKKQNNKYTHPFEDKFERKSDIEMKYEVEKDLEEKKCN